MIMVSTIGLIRNVYLAMIFEYEIKCMQSTESVGSISYMYIISLIKYMQSHGCSAYPAMITHKLYNSEGKTDTHQSKVRQ